MTDSKTVAVTDAAEEMLAAIVRHLREAHSVELDGTPVNYALTTVSYG